MLCATTTEARSLGLLTNAGFEPLAHQLLEPCTKDVANTATLIRKHLKSQLGRWQADALLSLYNNVRLRHKGVRSRYFTDKDGRTLKLRSLDVNVATVKNGRHPSA